MSKTRRLVAPPGQMTLLNFMGTPPLELLADYWRDANSRWFGGKLKPIPIIEAPFDKLKREKFTQATYGAFDHEITIRSSLLTRLDEPGLFLETTDSLLHEMIHQWVDEVRRAHWDDGKHGPLFTAKCNEIGEALGLVPVTQRKPRGRDGKLSRYWPCRPAGAYGLDNPRRVHWDRYWGEPLPRHTALVTRLSRFGNPFLVAEHGLDEAIRLHRDWLDGDGPDEIQIVKGIGDFGTYSRKRVLDALPMLAGYDLACACPEGQPCHGDTLLELASRTERKP